MATATNKHQASTATNLGLQGGEADYLHIHWVTWPRERLFMGKLNTMRNHPISRYLLALMTWNGLVTCGGYPIMPVNHLNPKLSSPKPYEQQTLRGFYRILYDFMGFYGILHVWMGFCYLFVQQPSQDPYDRREAQLVPRSYQGPASKWWGGPVLENVENQFLPDEHQFASFPESTRHFQWNAIFWVLTSHWCHPPTLAT